MARTARHHRSHRLLAALVLAFGALAAPLALASGPAPERAAALARWHPAYRLRCLPPDGAAGASRWTRALAALSDLVMRDDLVGRPLLDAARRHGAWLCLDDRYDGTFGYYDHDLNVIVLADRLSTGQRAVILVHELRHLDLVRRGYRASLDVDMEAAARVTLASEADVQAVATLFAWRMRSLGEPGPWAAARRLEHYQDIAPAFAATLKAGGDELAATRAAFERWFVSSWRTDTYHRSACMGYLDRCDEAKAVPSYRALPADWFDGMCVLPDGRDYGCEPPACP